MLTGLVKGGAGFRELAARLRKRRVGIRRCTAALLTVPLAMTVVLLALSLLSAQVPSRAGDHPGSLLRCCSGLAWSWPADYWRSSAAARHPSADRPQRNRVRRQWPLGVSAGAGAGPQPKEELDGASRLHERPRHVAGVADPQDRHRKDTGRGPFHSATFAPVLQPTLDTTTEALLVAAEALLVAAVAWVAA